MKTTPIGQRSSYVFFKNYPKGDSTPVPPTGSKNEKWNMRRYVIFFK